VILTIVGVVLGGLTGRIPTWFLPVSGPTIAGTPRGPGVEGTKRIVLFISKVLNGPPEVSLITVIWSSPKVRARMRVRVSSPSGPRMNRILGGKKNDPPLMNANCEVWGVAVREVGLFGVPTIEEKGILPTPNARHPGGAFVRFPNPVPIRTSLLKDPNTNSWGQVEGKLAKRVRFPEEGLAS
jgi:hypothetical protein